MKKTKWILLIGVVLLVVLYNRPVNAEVIANSNFSDINISVKETKIRKCDTIDLDLSDEAAYYYELDGITVIDYKELLFKVDGLNSFGSIKLYIKVSNYDYVEKIIYTFTLDEYVYISNISKDTAWYLAFNDLYECGKITLEEFHDAYGKLTNTYYSVTEENVSGGFQTRSSDGQTVVSGTIYWQYKQSDGSIGLLPLKNTLLQFYLVNLGLPTLYADGYTNNDGEFSFTITGDASSYDYKIMVYAESRTVTVAPDWTITYYSFQNQGTISSGTTIEKSFCLNYSEDNNLYKAFSVLQGMVMGEKYILEKGVNVSYKLNVCYPGFDAGSFSHQYYCAIEPDKYDVFDTLIHEYGHYVQHIKGLYSSSILEMLINNPNHTVDADHFEDKWQKEYAMELTWTESWACVFSKIVQRHYNDEYDGLAVDLGVEDERNYKYRYLDLELVNSTYSYNSCEAQEMAVICFLWDLYDAQNSFDLYDSSQSASVQNTYDFMWLDENNWWNITTVSSTYTLQDFVTNLYVEYADYIDDIGALLEVHQIAPGNLTSSYATVNSAPYLTFKVNGSQMNPNNGFDVVFFDSNNNVIYTSSVSSINLSYTSIHSFKVAYSDWESVLDEFTEGTTNIVRIAVRGYNLDSPYSGPYISKFVEIEVTIPSTHTHKYLTYESNNDGRTHKKICYCGNYVTESCTGMSIGIGQICAYCDQSLTSGSIIFSDDREVDNTTNQ